MLESILVRMRGAGSIFKCATALSGVLLLTPLPASGDFLLPFEKTVGSLTWRSNNSSFDGLQFSLEAHFLTLANLGLLDTSPVKTEKAIQYPATFFNDYFPYLNWTPRIDNLLCDLNGHVCSRTRTPIDLVAENLTDHVMGNGITDQGVSKWSIESGSLLNVPNVITSVQTTWKSHTILPGKVSLHELYRDVALGCPVATSTIETERRDWSLLNQQEFRFREQLRESEPDVCPVWVAQQNAYWLGYLANAAGAFQAKGRNFSAETTSREILSAISQVSVLADEGDLDGAWSRFDQLIEQVLPRNSTLPASIRLPVIAVTSDQVIYRDIEQDENLRFSDSWHREIQQLSLAERLNRLDPTEYLSAIIDDDEIAQLAEEIRRNPDFAEGLEELSRKVNQAAIVSEEAGVAIKGFDGIDWTFNSSYTRVPSEGYENSRHHEMIGFAPEASKPGVFSVPIFFVEKNFDKDHCTIRGGCDPDQFEIVSGKGLSDIEGIPATPDIKKRLAAIHEDMFTPGAKKEFHGNGVAAIALANPDSQLLHGIYPFARPELVGIDIAANFIEESEWNASQVPGNQVLGPATWNISGTTSKSANTRGITNIVARQLNDPVAAPFRDIFVVSGGVVKNASINPARRDIDCDFFPACHVTNETLQKSIVTVVGVKESSDNNVEIWSTGDSPADSTSFSHKDFQIAAPASGLVVPTIDPNYLAEVDGVSFAVPMVSATIAALRSKVTEPASFVIARVMACARQYSSLRGKVASGVLDVGCALAIDRDLVAFTEDIKGEDGGGEYQKIRQGRVVRIWSADLDGTYTNVIPFDDDGSEIWGDWRARPAIADSDRILFGIRQFGDSDELKITGLKVSEQEVVTDFRGPLDSSLVMEFQPLNADGTDKGRSVCFKLRDLREYIPAVTSVASHWPKAPGVPKCPR